MKILRISKTPLPEKALMAFSDCGMPVTALSPTLLSAMTSMKIAKAIGNGGYDVAMVDGMDNAMAAISARKLNPKLSFTIVFCVRPNSDVPKGIPKDIVNGVDTWIFPSRRLHDLYPTDLRRKAVLQPVSLAVTQVIKEKHPAPVIAWIGDIVHPEGLREALEQVDAQEGRFILRIAGAGLAKTVMPLVRLSRALRHTRNVEWIGEGYDAAAEMGRCDAVLLSAPDMTPEETIAVQNGLPLIRPTEIAAFLNDENSGILTADLSPATYLQTLKSLISEN